MGSFKDLLIFVAGFAVAWIVIRFIAIKWRDSMKKEGKILNRVQDDKVGVRDDGGVVQDDGGAVQDNEGGEKIVYVDKSELRLRQVQDYLKEKSEITNDEYQKLTGVSDAQATRDLDELEKQGIVEQIGATGSGVVYRKKE